MEEVISTTSNEDFIHKLYEEILSLKSLSQAARRFIEKREKEFMERTLEKKLK